MKRRKRVTKFTVETERTFVFRTSAASRAGWCDGCAARVEWTSVAEAALASGLSELAIYRLVEARALHFTEDLGGRVLVCLNSLRR